jgi:hypothetical protein
MTKISLYLILLSGLNAQMAWAHGNLFEQASGVTSTCLDVMLKNEPKKLVRLFQSTLTELTGNEAFAVTVTLRDGQTLNYEAVGVDGENGEFSWNCTKTDH